MSNADIIIDRLRADQHNQVLDDIQFQNAYKHDESYTYKVNKKDKVVTVMYKNITYSFELPVITLNLSPPISYLFFFKKRHKHHVIDTFKLEYKLALHYIIVLQTVIKTQINRINNGTIKSTSDIN